MFEITPLKLIAITLGTGFVCAKLVAVLGNRESEVEWKNRSANVFRNIGGFSFLIMFWAVIWWLWSFFFSSKSYFIASGTFIVFSVVPMLIAAMALRRGANDDKKLHKLNPIVYSHPSARCEKTESGFAVYDEHAYAMMRFSLESSQGHQMLKDGRIVEASPFEQNDGRVYVKVVDQPQLGHQLIMYENRVYRLEENTCGELVHTFDSKVIERIRYSLAIDERHIVLEADYAHAKGYTAQILWLWNTQSNELKELSSAPYYTHSMPPFVKRFGDITALVFYHESLSWNMVHGSNPKYSALWLFTPQYLEGVEVLRVSKKVGDIIDLALDEKDQSLIVACDPNKESRMEEEGFLPMRHLKLDIEKLI